MGPEQLVRERKPTAGRIFSPFGANALRDGDRKEGLLGVEPGVLITGAIMWRIRPGLPRWHPMSAPRRWTRSVRKWPLQGPPRIRWQRRGPRRSELRWIAESGSQPGVAARGRDAGRARQRLAWFSWLSFAARRRAAVGGPCFARNSRRRPVPSAPSSRFREGGVRGAACPSLAVGE